VHAALSAGSLQGRVAITVLPLSHLHVSSRILTFADVCLRMLADGWSRGMQGRVGMSVLGLGDFAEQFDVAILVSASNEGTNNLQVCLGYLRSCYKRTPTRLLLHAYYSYTPTLTRLLLRSCYKRTCAAATKVQILTQKRAPTMCSASRASSACYTQAPPQA